MSSAVILDFSIACTANVQKIIIAVPVVALDTLKKLQKEVDQVIYLEAPLFMDAIGFFYDKFEQTSDEEVIKSLK